MSTIIRAIVNAVRRVLSPSKIREGVRAARSSYAAFKRFYDDLPWYIRAALNPFNIGAVYQAFRDHL